MITEDKGLNIDFGLNTIFDGTKYRLVMAQSTDEYPVGGLICEYMRLSPMDIKDVIMSCSGLDKEGTTDNYLDTFLEFHEKINATFPAVISTMIALEFMSSSEDWFKAVRENRVEEYMGLINSSWTSVHDFIYGDTGVAGPGGDTVLQIMLTCYSLFADRYIYTKYLFNNLMESDEVNDEPHNKSIDVFSEMFGNHMDMQHIDYRLILTDKGFESLYTIKSSFSLLIFDMAHCINQEVRVVKCKNCGHYFVPEGRSDAVYCSYPLRDNKEKTCREVGAQVTRANKEKEDIATREYRKVYMRYKMATNRHPEDSDVAGKFQRLKGEIRSWRNRMSHGLATTEEFLEWLNTFGGGDADEKSNP